MQHSKRLFLLPAVALSAVLVLAACGGSDTSGSMNGTQHDAASSSTSSPSPAVAAGTPASGSHNAADVAFATEMLPHHRQAVLMADMAASRGASSQVKDLAVAINGAQAPEIARMSGWLTGWDAPIPSSGDMGGMDHSSSPMNGMNGMMSDQEMQRMRSMTGADFDRAFLTGMIAHHQGAVAMAGTELTDGSNGEAKTLAQGIKDSQSREINLMQKLLTEL